MSIGVPPWCVFGHVHALSWYAKMFIKLLKIRYSMPIRLRFMNLLRYSMTIRCGSMQTLQGVRGNHDMVGERSRP